MKVYQIALIVVAALAAVWIFARIAYRMIVSYGRGWKSYVVECMPSISLPEHVVPPELQPTHPVRGKIRLRFRDIFLYQTSAQLDHLSCNGRDALQTFTIGNDDFHPELHPYISGIGVHALENDDLPRSWLGKNIWFFGYVYRDLNGLFVRGLRWNYSKKSHEMVDLYLHEGLFNTDYIAVQVVPIGAKVVPFEPRATVSS